MRRADLCTSRGKGARYHTKSNHFALFCLTPLRKECSFLGPVSVTITLYLHSLGCRLL